MGFRSRADGMALDSAGRLYMATAAGVQVVDARGHHLGTIRVPSLVRKSRVWRTEPPNPIPHGSRVPVPDTDVVGGAT